MLKIVAMLVALTLNAVFIMLLWNFLMPELFHLAHINYGQALVLGVLCNCLFGRNMPPA